MRLHDAIHDGMVGEMLKAAPEDGGAGLAIRGAGEEAAELGDPADGLAQGGRGWRRGGGLVDDAVESLPFVGVEEGGAGQVGRGAGEQGGVEDAPGNDAEQRETGPESVSGLELAGLDLTPAF